MSPFRSVAGFGAPPTVSLMRRAAAAPVHYYDFNIGDYHKKTDHLTDDEDLAYRRLLDLYYDTEQPIPNETQSVSRRLRMSSKSEIVGSVLAEFFTLCDDGCWHNSECDKRILQYHEKCETNKINGLRGGRPKKNPVGSQSQPSRNPNQEPVTNNQEPNTPLTPLKGGVVVFNGGRNARRKKPASKWEEAADDYERKILARSGQTET